MTSMRRAVLAASALLATALPAAGPGDSPRQLTFEQRVAAQRAIERVYYSHQQGATRSFEEAVPRDVLEEKVRTYLKQSVALDRFWRTPVTAEALRRELERIESGSNYPDRLMEIYAALGQDAFLIQETFVRGLLVDRLARNFFAYDERIHGRQREEAEGLRRLLESGELDLRSDHPARAEVELVRGLGTNELEAMRARDVGGIGPVEEEREAFVIRAKLTEDVDRIRVATYTVGKRTWEDWWSQAGGEMPEAAARAVASKTAPPASRSTVSAPPSCVPEDTWDNGSLDDAPDPRAGHSAVWTGSVMIVWGGGPGGLQYDPLTDTWEAVARTFTEPIGGWGSGAVWTGQEMMVWDGALGRGLRYSPATQSVSLISTIGAPPPCGATPQWSGSEMIVWCGVMGTPPAAVGRRYDPRTDSWAPMTSFNAPALSGHASVWTGTEMVIWGRSASGVSEGGRYNPVTDSWSAISTKDAPVFHQYTWGVSAVWTGQVMVAWDYMDLNAEENPDGGGGLYDPATDSWSPLPDNYVAKAGGKTVWTGREVVVWGGTDSDGGPSDYGARYDPETNAWRLVDFYNGPGPRSGYSLVWTGTQMIVWGGLNGHRIPGHFVFSSGGRYDPVENAWTPTSVANNGQPPISHHAAVWTGSEMIVHGGGGRYDPLPDTWRSMSRVGSPGGGVVVWTGDEMLVWSGRSWGSLPPRPQDFELEAEGARYDPVTDTWRPISAEGAPTGVTASTGVWTGTEMIIWGVGCPSCAPDRLAGRYNPATDTWRPLSAVSAPPPRSNQRAVWTGREMIVWGVAPQGSQAGGRYDPHSDTWMPVSTNGAPVRGHHTLVWTGQDMIAWSNNDHSPHGSGYDPLTDTWNPISAVGAPPATEDWMTVWTGREMVVWGAAAGGRYDPASDRWSAVSLVGQPSRRLHHSAVWTGREMVIWGGHHPSEFDPPDLATGGRYYPQGTDADQDQDGFTACTTDCNDADGSINPQAVELPGNAVDENCDGALTCDRAGWKNRGQFVSCVVKECERLARAGVVSASRCREILSR